MINGEQETTISNPERSVAFSRIVLTSPHDSISLKELIPDDASLYFGLVEQDRDHLSQHGDVTAQKYQTEAAVRRSIKNSGKPQKYRFGIWDNDVMVGSNNLTPKDGNRAELGSWIGKVHTGSNYAARARTLLVDFAFNQLQLDEVFCEIVIGNVASQKSVEKSGFALTSIENGRWVYTLTRAQYEAAQ